jgi:6,7-dimethyl-8-ribityllumazine synthase
VLQAAESEVSFGDLNGESIRIGIIRTRWNDEHVSNLVKGIRSALKDCKVQDENVFETEVPGSFELPLAAKYLALSGTVDAIVTTGVLIKGDTMHFEYIADTVSSGIMSVNLQTNIPVIFGVLTCLTEEQVKARSSEGNNHGYDWGKTAVEMGLLRQAAMGMGKTAGKAGGFVKPDDKPEDASAPKKEKVGFF